MLASFWKAFGDSIWISTAFLVGFAIVIAFGVVYNGARIALSERGNELACLRVLGYTRGEIGRILLGEQGLLTLAAIPAGFALGFALSLLLSRFFSRDLFRLAVGCERRNLRLRGDCRFGGSDFLRPCRCAAAAAYGSDGRIEVEGVRIVYEANRQAGFHDSGRRCGGHSHCACVPAQTGGGRSRPGW